MDTARAWPLVSVLIAVFAVSCDQGEHRPFAPVDGAPQFTQVSGTQIPYDLDEEWAQIARDLIPGFAGFHRVESGEYVVSVTQPARARQAQQLLHSRLAAAGKRNVVTRARAVRFAFDELHAWKQALKNVIDGEDVYWLDIDEVENRLIFGVKSRTARDRILVVAHSLGVPREAVDVVEAAKPVKRVSLRNHVRPVVGGLQIQRTSGDSIFSCTLGFNAVRGTSDGFVTNSHCSTSDPGTDGTVQFQATTGSASNRLGAETFDPTGTRRSDAAFYTYDSGVQRDWGHIARTTFVSVNQRGSLEIDSVFPKFRITSKAANSLQFSGELVNKVGRTTGWTQGQVLRTCVTLDNLPCQWEARVFSWLGDSGSPMFQQNGPFEPDASRVALWGILWGGPSTDSTTTWYSPISGVEQDLGTLAVACDPSASVCEPPPPPLAVSIDGPTWIGSPGSYTWEAVHSGGQAPFTYQWRWETANVGAGPLGTQKTQSLNIDGSEGDFGLFATVSSADGQVQTAQVFVTNSAGCPPPEIICD